MEKYLDALPFQANWGSNVLVLRLSAAALPLKEEPRHLATGARR